MQCPKPIRVKMKEVPGGMLVPCGKCIICRIAKRNEWAMRLIHELGYHKKSVFLTLTYDEEHINNERSLKKNDLQKFFKRLRRNYDEKIKYFGCGEYGDKNHRPHYHAILYGIGFDFDYSNIWPLGFIHKGLVEKDSIQYVCAYIEKKLNGEKAKEEYTDKGLEAPFRVLSQGIGKQYCIDNEKQIKGSYEIVLNGKSRAVPRYYSNMLNLDTEVLKERAVERDKIKVEKYTGICDISEDEFYKVSKSDEFMKYYEERMKRKNAYKELVQARINLREKPL